MIAYGTVTEDGDFIPDPEYRHFMKRFKGRARIVQDSKEKERMYAYYQSVIIQVARLFLRDTGIEADEADADIFLKDMFAKKEVKNPYTENESIILIDKKDMSKTRLREFMQDCIFYLERMGYEVPQADKNWKKN
jgi:hypothetical protein